jgi:SSS family solute:Na+ symporter
VAAAFYVFWTKYSAETGRKKNIMVVKLIKTLFILTIVASTVVSAEKSSFEEPGNGVGEGWVDGGDREAHSIPMGSGLEWHPPIDHRVPAVTLTLDEQVPPLLTSMGSGLDLIIIAVYFCILVAVGIVFGRIVKTGGDYFRAGARGTWWLIGSSMFMSGISAYTFVGNAAGIYRAGWSVLSIYVANVVGFVFAALFLAAWYRQMRIITFAEALKERFGKTAEQLVSYLLVFQGYIWSGVVLYSLAVFTQVIIPGTSVEQIIFEIGFVVILYCTVGGSWAVMANDFVQGLILIAITGVITVLCFYYAGGIGGFFDAAAAQPAAADQLRFITPVPVGQTMWGAHYVLPWIVMSFVVQFVNQVGLTSGSRYFSAKDGREASKGAILAGILMALGILVFFIPPIYARLFLEEQVMAMSDSPAKAVEFAYAVASYAVLPKGVFSIMLVAIFAAAISTLDTGLNRNAALIIRDLLPPLRRKLGFSVMRPEKEVFFAKIATLASGMVLMGVALIYSMLENITIFDLMLQITGRLSFPILIPLVLFLFVRKVPRWSLLSSVAGGYIPSLIELLFGLSFSYQMMSLLVLSGGCAGFFISCLFWKRTSAQEKEETAAFYRKMGRPVDFKKEVGVGNDAFQLIQIGRFAALMGGLSLLLLIPLNTAAARWTILVVAGFVGGIGILMMAYGKRIKKKIS